MSDRAFSPKSRLCARIHTTEFLLAEMTTPIQNPALAHMHIEYIKRIRDLTREAKTILLGMESGCRDDTDVTELVDFRTSIINIKYRTSVIHTDLCTWEAKPSPRASLQ